MMKKYNDTHLFLYKKSCIYLKSCIQPQLHLLKEKTKPPTVFFEPTHDTSTIYTVYFSNLILRNHSSSSLMLQVAFWQKRPPEKVMTGLLCYQITYSENPIKFNKRQQFLYWNIKGKSAHFVSHRMNIS